MVGFLAAFLSRGYQVMGLRMVYAEVDFTTDDFVVHIYINCNDVCAGAGA